MTKTKLSFEKSHKIWLITTHYCWLSLHLLNTANFILGVYKRNWVISIVASTALIGGIFFQLYSIYKGKKIKREFDQINKEIELKIQSINGTVEEHKTL